MVDKSSLLLPFQKALATLKLLEKETYSDAIRDAWIQRFKYTLEQACRLLQKILKKRGIEIASPREIVRLSAKEGLLSDSASWLLFIEKRNLTSHTYNSETANEVYQVIPKFVEEADRLFATLSNLKDI